MKTLTKSEKDWLVILLIFMIGAASYFMFRHLPAYRIKKQDESFTEQAQRIERSTAPLGQQER